MTNSKSNKTLIGLPSDVQDVLQKLNEQEQERAAAQAGRAPQAPLNSDLLRTQYGNAHAQSSGAARPSGPPPLPSLQPFQPPPGYRPPPPVQAPVARAPGSMQQTLLGMVPTGPQASYPNDSGSGRTHDRPGARRADAIVSQALSNLPQRQSPEPSVVVSGREAAGGHGGHDGHDGHGGHGGHDGQASRALSLELGNPALAAGEATRAEGFDGMSTAGAPYEERAPERPRLSLDNNRDRDRTTTRNATKTQRRWLVIGLSSLAIAAVGGAGAWRVARMVQASRASEGQSRAASEAVNAADPSALGPSTGPSKAEGTVTEVSAATAARAITAANPTPSANTTIAPAPEQPAVERGPVPAAVDGAAAELERQAIELLIANDKAAAARVYERLRVAEPAHREYALMIELLTRAACGQPGQAPCAAH